MLLGLACGPAGAAVSDAPPGACGAVSRALVQEVAPRLRAIPEDAASEPRRPGAWSPREIVGHLVDSATNNHGRFLRAQLQDDLVFLGYDQEAWVRVQRYAEAPWPDLVALWEALNLHLARVIEAVPPEVADHPRPVHALHRLAWEVVPEDEPVTLGYFMRDYVGHLRHHLRQVDPALSPAPRLQLGGSTRAT